MESYAITLIFLNKKYLTSEQSGRCYEIKSESLHMQYRLDIENTIFSKKYKLDNIYITAPGEFLALGRFDRAVYPDSDSIQLMATQCFLWKILTFHNNNSYRIFISDKIRWLEMMLLLLMHRRLSLPVGDLRAFDVILH